MCYDISSTSSAADLFCGYASGQIDPIVSSRVWSWGRNTGSVACGLDSLYWENIDDRSAWLHLVTLAAVCLLSGRVNYICVSIQSRHCGSHASACVSTTECTVCVRLCRKHRYALCLKPKIVLCTALCVCQLVVPCM